MSMKEFIMLNVFICTVTSDLQNYKIRNPVITAGWIAGICLNFISSGLTGALNSVFCIVSTIIIGLPLFIIGGTGAGDIKLLSVIGGAYGLVFLGKVTLLLLLIAGTVSLVKLVRKKALVLRVKAFICYLLHWNTVNSKYYDTGRDGYEFTVCLAPVMAVAYFITLLMQERR
ncbi:MAG TPA: hypothetical protein DCZ23_05090 [Lachnospiraceae bacterium]|nr:hypothetical protein [Lachnospiraceae bacterium]